MVRGEFQPGTFGEVEADAGRKPGMGEIENPFLNGNDAAKLDLRRDDERSRAGLDDTTSGPRFDNRFLPAHAAGADIDLVNRKDLPRGLRGAEFKGIRAGK